MTLVSFFPTIYLLDIILDRVALLIADPPEAISPIPKVGSFTKTESIFQRFALAMLFR